MNDEALKKLTSMYSELETKLLDEIVEHFKLNEEFINSDYWRAEKLEELGILNQNIGKYIANITKKTPKEIEEALTQIGFDTLNINNLNEAYKGGLLKVNPAVLLEKQIIQNLINYAYNETTNRFLEISNKIEQSTRQAYLGIVENAYLQTTNGVTYSEAIRNSLLELGDKGITTLTYRTVDSEGNTVGIRNYDVEGAVRRELITANHNLVNNINQAVAEELEVEYLYLSEHIKCRPTHFPWQGTIIKRKDLAKVTRLGEVDGMGEPNCKHYPTPYFGTARGNELKKISLEEATKQYELSQKQRYLERGIRKWKRKERIFKNAEDKEYYNKCKDKVKEWQLRTKKFTEDNNLRREFARENVERVTKVENDDIIGKALNKEEEELNYQDITNQYKDKKHYEIRKQKYFVTDDGVKHYVDGRNVLLKTTQDEREVADILGQAFGGKVKLVPVVLQPKGIQTPDYIINNKKFDLKQIVGNGKNTLDTAISKKKKQSNNFVFDISKSKMEIEQVLSQIDRIYNAKNRTWVDVIILIKDKEILKVFKRK